MSTTQFNLNVCTLKSHQCGYFDNILVHNYDPAQDFYILDTCARVEIFGQSKLHVYETACSIHLPLKEEL